MAKKPDLDKVYKVKWRDPSKIKRTWGPFKFDVATGISIRTFTPWSKAIQNITHNPKFKLMFELIECHKPHKCSVIQQVKESEPIEKTMRKLREEEFKAIIARIEKEEKFENDDLPDKIIEEFHKKEEKKNKKKKNA